MRTELRRCRACAKYTMKDRCPKCGGPTEMPIPARYSPQDNYGKYRRGLKELNAGS
jgi:H/ACA ribonucleoprotein complex subunit 3